MTATPEEGVGSPGRVAVLVLAAGSSHRFGTDKLVAQLDGRGLLQTVLDSALAIPGVGPVRLVIRPGQSHTPGDDRVDRVENPRHAEGLSTSVRAGLASLAATDVAGALIMLGDQPLITAGLCSRLVRAWQGRQELPVIACYGNEPRNPVVVPRRLWPLVEDLEGDRGLGQTLRALDPVLVECSDLGSDIDVDTPADLAELVSEVQRSRT